MKSTAALTPRIEYYLHHLYRLEQETDGRVSNSAIAGRLGVTRATVSSMLETLSDCGLIEREWYRPVRLTTEGKELALWIIRRHRLVETMLSELFDHTISEVDTEADILEHHLSPRLCREIEQKLNMPETDPQGDPIPDTDLNILRALDIDRGWSTFHRYVHTHHDGVIDEYGEGAFKLGI